MKPLKDNGCEVLNLDPIGGDGIDLPVTIDRLDYCDKSFDVILINSVIEHLHPGEDKVLIYHTKRLLNDNGIVIASSPANYPLHDRFDNKIRMKSVSDWEIYFPSHTWDISDFTETNKLPAKPYYKDFKDDTWMTMCKVKKKIDTVTVVCPTWKRYVNIPEIIMGVRESKYPSKILIWDNGGKLTDTAADYTICSSNNFESKIKNVLPLLITTKYVLIQDDDLKIHPDTITIMKECCDRHPDSIICLKYGVTDNDGNYIASNLSTVEQPVDYPVGRVLFMHTALAHASFLPLFLPIFEIGEEDLCLGLATQLITNEPSYAIDYRRCKPIELDGRCARCAREYHFANRTLTINKFKDLGWTSLVK